MTLFSVQHVIREKDAINKVSNRQKHAQSVIIAKIQPNCFGANREHIKMILIRNLVNCASSEIIVLIMGWIRPFPVI